MERTPTDIASKLFGPDEDEPMLQRSKEPNSHSSAQGAAMEFLANVDSSLPTNFVDLDAKDPGLVFLSYVSGDVTFTLEA